MPGDTKIRKNQYGEWIDVDNPTVGYPARRLARDARRGATLPKVKQPKPTSLPQAAATSAPTTTTLTSLQSRLVDRLTQRQGVDMAAALFVVANYGYNAAASYGHMREAGANHFEALAVIDLGSPDVSVAYGFARGAGYNHTGALAKALREASDDDSDD